MTQCPYYYHSWSNIPPKRCSKQEGHEGEHEEEKVVALQPQQLGQQLTGWRKH